MLISGSSTIYTSMAALAHFIRHDLNDTLSNGQQLNDTTELLQTHYAVLHKAEKTIGRLNMLQAKQAVIIQHHQAHREQL